MLTEAGIHFSGHLTGNDLENLFPEDDADLIESLMHHVFNRGVVTDQLAGGKRLTNQILISGDLRGSEDQGWAMVASRGVNLRIASRSPVSATTTVIVESCSSKLAIVEKGASACNVAAFSKPSAVNSLVQFCRF